MNGTEQEHARFQEIGYQTTGELVKVCLRAHESAEAAGASPLVARHGVLSALLATLARQATDIAMLQHTGPFFGDADLMAEFHRGFLDVISGILGRDFSWPESGKTGRA